jgi:hypothetical protein
MGARPPPLTQDIGHPTRVEYRWASGHYDRLPALTAELVGLPVLVFAASGGETAHQLKRIVVNL